MRGEWHMADPPERPVDDDDLNDMAREALASLTYGVSHGIAKLGDFREVLNALDGEPQSTTETARRHYRTELLGLAYWARRLSALEMDFLASEHGPYRRVPQEFNVEPLDQRRLEEVWESTQDVVWALDQLRLPSTSGYTRDRVWNALDEVFEYLIEMAVTMGQTPDQETA